MKVSEQTLRQFFDEMAGKAPTPGGGSAAAVTAVMAASLVTMLPVVLDFFLAQRLFIEGITLTGMKG